jgi:hypothetical protein
LNGNDLRAAPQSGAMKTLSLLGEFYQKKGGFAPIAAGKLP